MDIEQIDASFSIEASVNYALSIGKSGNVFKDLWTYMEVFFKKINIDPILMYNEKELDEYIETIEANLPDQVIQSSFYVEDKKLIIVNGTNGVEINKEEFKDNILNAIQSIEFANAYLEIPVNVKYPDKIDLNKIHDEIYKEAENAYFTTEPYNVYAEVIGVDFDVSKANDIIEANPSNEEYEVSLIYTTPEVTVDDLGKEAFPNLISSFSTKYAASNTNRTTNLRLASNKINGTVVMPGETFSYNQVVGKRTIAAGYKEAAIYQDGQVTNGLGGGICQISTTLYNAVIGADLGIVSRRNHMFVPSYVTAGKDATVVWGSTDFKFKNTRNYPIKIESSVSGGVAKVNIYGLKTDNEYDSIVIEAKTIKKTSTNIVVDAYKVYRNNGEVVKREKLSTDTYKLH